MVGGLRASPLSSSSAASDMYKVQLLRGFKDIPWNEARRGLVGKFFSADMIPDIDPYKARNTVVSVTLFGYK